MHPIRVNLPGDQAYNVLVNPGALGSVGVFLRERFHGLKKAAVVTDTTVAKHWLPAVKQSLADAQIEPLIAIIEPGEENKTLASASAIFDQLLPKRIDRQTPVVALGGGIVGDVAGFVAGTLLRGVPFVQCPTTLLAMVDASVGGKTGVNHSAGKNLIGVFHQPAFVVADPLTLTTLPPSELRDGLAECIKHGVIRSAPMFAEMETNLGRILSLDIKALMMLIMENVAIKARVVEADPLERGERAHLNFGHTFAHAIENVSEHSFTHGQAVALGMTAATRLAVDLKLLDGTSGERILKLIADAGLPTGKMNLDPKAVVDAMAYDKKVVGGKIRLILPDRIGHVIIRDDVSGESILTAVNSLRA